MGGGGAIASSAGASTTSGAIEPSRRLTASAPVLLGHFGPGCHARGCVDSCHPPRHPATCVSAPSHAAHTYSVIVEIHVCFTLYPFLFYTFLSRHFRRNSLQRVPFNENNELFIFPFAYLFVSNFVLLRYFFSLSTKQKVFSIAKQIK